MIQKCQLATALPPQTQLLVCGVYQDQAWDAALGELDLTLVKLVREEIKRMDFTGKEEQQVRIFHGKSSLTLLLLGLGKKEAIEDDRLLNLGAKASSTAKSLKLSLGAIGTSDQNPTPSMLSDIAIGLHLGLYQFDKYKKKDDSPMLDQAWTLMAKDPAHYKNILSRSQTMAEAIARARDWVNEPSNKLTPATLAQQASELAEAKGLKCKVLGPKEIQKENMNLFLAVASGSTANPPAFIHLQYKPSKKSRRKVFLVGKGVTFDSGGLSLKPGPSMMTMKMDMGGAAAVIAAIGALADLKADIEIHAIVAATENMPDGLACRPGDIVKGRNGTSVEILNTDAEGRLTLGDALSYAVDNGATEIIDLATLTGACMVALGPHAAALYSDHSELRQGLLKAAQESKEELWPMPLSKGLKKSIKSPVADLKNIGGAYGGSITAALFLQHFVGEVPWAHLDIAGPAYSEEDQGYIGKGGRGYGVRTLVEYLCPLA